MRFGEDWAPLARRDDEEYWGYEEERHSQRWSEPARPTEAALFRGTEPEAESESEFGFGSRGQRPRRSDPPPSSTQRDLRSL
ncbi:MAG: hypothetical protein MJD61_08120, partial [Proteobacteria bacterium]|nr:hypothetical protein [Pseudomonadota bacterium]